MIGKLSGEFTRWTMFDFSRTYGTVQNLPYSEATEYIMAVRYNGTTGKGQQRELVAAHAKKLKAEMECGTFTPTNVSANCNKRHHGKLALDDATGRFVLEVDSDDPLIHSDGGHRYEAIGMVVADLEDQIEKAGDNPEKVEKLKRWLEQAKRLPVTVTVYFDGDPQKDFLNLQLGRPVDAAQMLSMKLQHRMADEPELKLAFEVAKVLAKQPGSPYANSIRFDSRGSAALPISTLCSRGKSDLGTSLVGLGSVGMSADGDKSPEWLAGKIVTAFDAIKADAPDLLEYGKVLTPLCNSGGKGSATMLIGLGTCLAYRMVALGRADVSADDLEKLVEAAKLTLDEKVNGSFSAQDKRKLLGEFAKVFFSDLTVDKHAGLPVGLLKSLSASTFAVPPLPKEPKPKPKPAPKPKKPAPQPKPKAPTATKKKKTLPDVDGPVGDVVTIAAPPADATVAVAAEPTVAVWEDKSADVTPAPWEGVQA